jgi:hypothetical protein
MPGAASASSRKPRNKHGKCLPGLALPQALWRVFAVVAERFGQ